jgi:membrane-associated protease RseP (regulator of RpoE activity)
VLNVVLFLATVGTTILSGASLEGVPGEGLTWQAVALAGLPFSAAIIGILLSHELGHYLMARAYGVDSTLPFFIPGPPEPFGVGTFGAVIRLRSPMPSRRAVLDIGAAGPIAGFAVAVPLLVWGLSHSEVRPIGDLALSNAGSPYALLHAFLRGEAISWGEGGARLMGDSVLTWFVGRRLVGPLPPGYDVFLHPVAFAAWIGLLVTTLNLIPIGQLDGGHVGYALLGGQGAQRFSRLVSWGLLLCGIFLSWSWLLWWILTRWVVGLRHPPALLEEPLDPARRLVALLSFVIFALTFIPVPISV